MGYWKTKQYNRKHKIIKNKQIYLFSDKRIEIYKGNREEFGIKSRNSLRIMVEDYHEYPSGGPKIYPVL